MASSDQQLLLPTYDESFLEHHAGNILDDPTTALIELVANAWDAGAVRVQITWPQDTGRPFAIEDDGCGMTPEEFAQRWTRINYNRQREFGDEVEFPPGVRKNRRVAFGRNGVGRHAMFCFASEYTIETRKGGTKTTAKVRRAEGSGLRPFDVAPAPATPADGHGTRLSAVSRGAMFPVAMVVEQIGSHFVTDPDFTIEVNGKAVELTDLDHLCDRATLDVEGVGQLRISRFDSEKGGKTSRPHGIAWWVNRRLVGRPGWNMLIDLRRSAAKRYTYIVEADQLKKHVKQDWSAFRAAASVEAAERAVAKYVVDDLSAAMEDVRRERKVAALTDNVDSLRKIPPISQEHVARFADEIQVQCPNISDKELTSAVMVLANLEKARSGYALLEKLSTYTPDDLDDLNAVLAAWTVTDLREVVDELNYRLVLIKRLEALVDDKRADELHELQPLFERGLWIFGPEFESVDFVSNRTLNTIVEHFFKSEGALESPKSRPDFVILPDRSLGIYAADRHDDDGEVAGFRKVVIVELKKGGFEVTHKEKTQAHNYCRELRRSGKVERQTKIVAYVLGSTVGSDDADELRDGENTVIIPRSYTIVLRQAHARTFNLLRKLESFEKFPIADPDLVKAMAHGAGELF